MPYYAMRFEEYNWVAIRKFFKKVKSRKPAKKRAASRSRCA